MENSATKNFFAGAVSQFFLITGALDLSNGCQIKITSLNGSSLTIYGVDFRVVSSINIETGGISPAFASGLEGNLIPEIRPLGVEAAICSRYYQTGKYYWRGHTLNGANHGGVVRLDTPMRIAPTVTTANSGTPTNFASIASTTANVATTEFEIYRAANSTGGGNFADTWTANAELV